ncbi:MAG: glycosyl transferase group 1, partial [Candidatus Micrarchaeum acidiphilum ARMAN-2]
KKLKQVFINLQKAIRVQNRLDEKKLISMGYKGKIYNIPPFINIPKKTSSTKSERFIALSVSRLSIKHKGIDLLCEVIEKTLNKTDKIIFYIVGSGDDGETLIRNLENKYPKNVKWFGFIDETILYKIYQRSNLFISTSRGENFGINVGEAQISGLPTIAFDVMGSQDIITNKIQGELIKPFDVNKFSNSIIKFYDFYNKNEAGYKNLKKKISDISIKRYNYKLIIKLLIKMFID